MYSLHTSSSPMPSGETDTLYLYKVTLVSLGLTYIPSKMSRNPAEAREIAAEHTLVQLGCPTEGAFVWLVHVWYMCVRWGQLMW